MKVKKIVIILGLVLSILFLSSCSTSQENESSVVEGENEDLLVKEEYGITIDENTVSFLDGREERVTINKHPERVVCLFTSYLEIWDKAGGKVIGKIEDTSDKPVEGAKDAEIVGTLGAPSLEKIISLEPDMVILNANSKINMELVPALEQSDIDIVALNFFVKDDYFKIIRLFTALTEREDLYTEYGLNVRKDVESIIDKVPEGEAKSALLMVAVRKI